MSVRNQPLLQHYPHIRVVDQPEHGYSSSQLLTRLNAPVPLMSDEPRMHNIRSTLRNHHPVQHGSFADDFYPQDIFQPQVHHPVNPFMSSETQQRMLPEVPQDRRKLPQSSLSSKKLTRPPIRSPVPQKNQPSPPARHTGNLRSNVTNKSASNSPISSANKKSCVVDESDPNRKKISLLAKDKSVHSSKILSKVNTKSPTDSTKAPAITTKTSAKPPTVVVKTSVGVKVEKESKKEGTTDSKPKTQTTLPTEKKMPSLFGPPPSAPAPAYKETDHKGKTPKSTAATGTSNRNNVVEIVESLPPKPLMDITPSLSELPFSNTLFADSTLHSGSAVSTVKVKEQLESDMPPEPIPNTGKPVPLLDVQPVPLFDIKPVPLFDIQPPSSGTKNTSECKNKSLESSLVDKSELIEVKSKHAIIEIEDEEDSSANKEMAKEESNEKELTASGKEAAKEHYKEQNETKNYSSSISHTEQITEPEESYETPRPLWYTNPDSLGLQPADATSALTGDIEQNYSSNEVEEGEIIGENTDDMEITENTETIHHKAVDRDSVVITPEITGECSSNILKRFYAAPEEFTRFLPFPADASEENFKSIEKCWQQLLILRSFTTKKKKNFAQKTMGRIKSHFAQEKLRPTNSSMLFCFKLWNHIATYLGTYLQQRLENFVRSLVHRSMIDFILIHMHKKKMPRSLKNVQAKVQINLLYIFNMQGFTNATNNYMVKWLQDEVEKVGYRFSSNSSNPSTATRFEVNQSSANARLNSLVLDDQLIEKKFCLVEYLKSKSFGDAKEEEQCIQICAALKCQDYLPNTEWKYEKTKSNPPSTSVPAPQPRQAVSLKSDSPNNEELKPGSEVSGKRNITPTKTNNKRIQKVAHQSDGMDDSEAEKKVDVQPTPASSKRSVQDEQKYNTESKIADIEQAVATTSLVGDTNCTEKTDNNENTQMAEENMSITIPEIEVTPAEKTTELSSNNSTEKHHLLNDGSVSKKKGNHSRKLHHANTAGKWRSYTVDGSSSCGGSSNSRVVSRRRKQELIQHSRKRFDRYRSCDSSMGRSRLSNRSTSSERSHYSDEGKAVNSDSDSEELEMMMLRKEALLSMLKGKKSSDNESKETETKGQDKLKAQQQEANLDPSSDKLAVEQISDTESNPSPVAYSIAESGVVLVSLGPDSVVKFPSQYNAIRAGTQADKPVQNKDDDQMPVEKQADSKAEASDLKPEPLKSSNEAVAAYYKVCFHF